MYIVKEVQTFNIVFWTYIGNLYSGCITIKRKFLRKPTKEGSTAWFMLNGSVTIGTISSILVSTVMAVNHITPIVMSDLDVRSIGPSGQYFIQKRPDS